MTDRERLLDELRPVAFAIAYRMLGSVAEAEDVVQVCSTTAIRRSRRS
jgi:DNA-directed RNA polymerase specialized sigma24 family protein